MVEHAFIRLSDESDLVSTVVLDGNGHVLHGVTTQPLAEARALTEGRRTTVLVPGASVVTTRANVPKASPARLRRMLAYSLEDNFAEDIDELLFAPGPWLESGAVTVAVVAIGRLEAWIERLRAAGIAPSALCAASDGVPDTPSTVNLVLEGDTTMGRSPGEPPFLLDDLSLAELWDVLESAQADESKPKHAMLYVDREALATRQAEIDELRGRVASIDVRELTEGCLPRLASTLVFAPGTNLLQGAYAPRSNVRALLRPWRVAAALGVALAVVSIGAVAVEFLTLSRDDRTLTAQTEELCVSSFGSRQVNACRAEMQRRLSSVGEATQSGNTGFLATLAVVADATTEDAMIEMLSYRDSELTLELIVPSVEHLDGFRSRVDAGTELDVQILTYSAEDSGVKGRVQIAGTR
jgi:general secretion pathway protein L